LPVLQLAVTVLTKKLLSRANEMQSKIIAGKVEVRVIDDERERELTGDHSPLIVR
jgi:hypothetical protein